MIENETGFYFLTKEKGNMKPCGTQPNSFERRLTEVIVDYAQTRDSEALEKEKARSFQLEGKLKQAHEEIADYKRIIGQAIDTTTSTPENNNDSLTFIEFLQENQDEVEEFYDTMQDLVFTLCPYCCHVKNMHEYCCTCYRELECPDWCNSHGVYFPLQTCPTCQKQNCITCASNCSHQRDFHAYS